MDYLPNLERTIQRIVYIHSGH